MQVNGTEGAPTGQPPAGSGDLTPPANTGGQGDPAAPNSGQGQQTPPAGDGGQGAAGKDPEDLDGLKKSLEATRAEKRAGDAKARELQKALDARDQRLKEIDDANKSELERTQEALTKAQKEAADAQALARTTTLRYEIARHATAQNFRDPEDAYTMLDISKVEHESDGTPKGIEELVKTLATAKPYLLKDDGQQQANGNGNGAQSPKPSPSSALTGHQTPPDVDQQRKDQQLREVRNML